MHEHSEGEVLLLYVNSDVGEEAVVTAALDDNGVPYILEPMDMHSAAYPMTAIEGYSRILVLDENAKRAHEVICAALEGKDVPPPSKKHQSLGPAELGKPGSGQKLSGTPPRHQSR